MAAFNVVRFRVRQGPRAGIPGAHRRVDVNWPALKHANIIRPAIDLLHHRGME